MPLSTTSNLLLTPGHVCLSQDNDTSGVDTIESVIFCVTRRSNHGDDGSDGSIQTFSHLTRCTFSRPFFTELSVLSCYLMKVAACVHRRHHSDHHTQPGCQRHCVDENLERRNHYLDLAGIENYTSRFGAGEWTPARGERGARLWPFEAASTAPHHGGTCLEPLGGTTRQHKHLGAGEHNPSSVRGPCKICKVEQEAALMCWSVTTDGQETETCCVPHEGPRPPTQDTATPDLNQFTIKDL